MNTVVEEPNQWLPRGAAADVVTNDLTTAVKSLLPKSLRELMTLNPTCIRPHATVLELVQVIHAKKFRHLLVTDDEGRLVGVVSDRDVVRCFGHGEYPDEAALAKISAAEIMSADVVTLGPDELPATCIETMQHYGINCMPITVAGKPIGIVTTADLLALLKRIFTA